MEPKHEAVTADEILPSDIKAMETTSVASRLLNLPQRSLIRMLAAGTVPGVKVGRCWRVSGAWLKSALFPEEV